MKPFRKHHLLQILEKYETSQLPLDTILRLYFRQHTAIGSKDRRSIAEKLYRVVRLQGRLDYHLQKPITWEDRLQAPHEILPSMPPHIQVSLPKFLFDKLHAAYGLNRALELGHILNETAPTTGRINPLKTDRETFLKSQEGLSPTTDSPLGFIFDKKPNIFAMPAFKAGLFELQDESSQRIALEVDAKPGDHVLDYCAGSGGKSLAFAYKLQGKGLIHLHDSRTHALEEARKRMQRAGIQNFTIWKKGSQKMDWLLLDVPCSGMGTLRRNPDLKWRLTEAMIDSLIQTQREIFAEAFPFAKEKIVYSTCSLLPEENENQVAFFLEHYPITLVKEPLKLLPSSGGGDGLFAATFILK